MIDVIIPAYLPTQGHHRLLLRAVRSLEKQSHKDFGVIIVLNGCYTDVQKIIDSVETELDIRWEILEGKASGAIARNRGVAASQKNLIAQLDADDQYHPEKLKKQIEFFSKNPEYSFVGTLAWDYHGENDIRKSCFDPGQYQDHEKISRALQEENIMCHGSIMFKRSDFLALDGYNESHKPGNFWPEYGSPMWEDWDLWKRAIQFGFKMYNIPERLYYWSVGTAVDR